MGRLQFGNGRAFAPLERIDLRPAIAKESVGVDQLQHLHLFAIDSGGRSRSLQSSLPGALGKGNNYRMMGDIRPGIIASSGQNGQLFEVVAPGRLHGPRIGEISFVQFLNVRDVRAKQIRIGKHLLHHGITFGSVKGTKKKGSVACPLADLTYRLASGNTLRWIDPV